MRIEIISLLLLPALLCSCRTTQKEAELLSLSCATDEAFSHFRKAEPALSEHLVSLSDPKSVAGPKGKAWLVSLYDARSGNPSYMQSSQIEAASHTVVIFGSKNAPVVITDKKQIATCRDNPEQSPERDRKPAR